MIRADPDLKIIPVMILSSSADVPSVQRAYACGANIFFSKPVTLERYQELMGLISRLWAGLAELPSAQPVGS